jgi:adenylyltransferase/sulfurtransferase
MNERALTVEPEGRFSRLALIEWWDQERLAGSRVLVVGAGAIGNEVIKNLSLMGVGHLAVVDMDRIEVSNLSRSVLFRAADAGQSKAQVAAAAARGLFPDIDAVPVDANVVHGVGLGLFRWADVVVGALDNREARLHVNRCCYRVGKPWIDGAIESLSGLARVFAPPEGACYECTMSALDWKLLEQRRSCSLLNRELGELGKVPTTPTVASVIAGIECQEALKLLHGREAMAGRGFVFDGHAHDSYTVDYQRNPDCMSHEPFESVIELGTGAATTTVAEALDRARQALGPAAILEFARELLLGLDCPECGDSQRLLRPLTSLTEADAACPRCSARRFPRLFHNVRGDEDFLGESLARIGVPPWDILVGRHGERTIGLELTADREAVLGVAADR